MKIKNVLVIGGAGAIAWNVGGGDDNGCDIAGCIVEVSDIGHSVHPKQ